MKWKIEMSLAPTTAVSKAGKQHAGAMLRTMRSVGIHFGGGKSMKNWIRKILTQDQAPHFSSGIGRILLVSMLGITMNACSSSESWKEEVQLSDGRMIVVERERLGEGGGDEWAFNRSGTKPKEYRIRFVYQDGSGKEVEWRSTKKSPQTWPEIPLILDVEAGQYIVFSIVAISAGCEIYSKYVYRNGLWIEETILENFEKQTTNLFLKN